MTGMVGRGRWFAGAALLLAVGAAGCSDPAAERKAAAETEAQAAEKERIGRIERTARHDAECINAIRWQEKPLATTVIGPTALYIDHFREELEATLGTETLPAQPPAPALTRDSIGTYLEATYPVMVETQFSADGGAAGFATIQQCVLEVAERGKGPLAKLDKVQRMYRVQSLPARLGGKGS